MAPRDPRPEDFIASGEATIQAPSLEPESPPPRGCLVYVSSGGTPDQGRAARFEQGQLIIGRDEDCGLVLADHNVSR